MKEIDLTAIFNSLKMGEYLAAEEHYLIYKKTNNESDLDRLVLCLLFLKKINTRAINRLNILSEYSFFRTRIAKSFPFAFQYFLDSASSSETGAETLFEAFDWMYATLPNYRKKNLMELLQKTENYLKDYYLNMPNPPLFKWMLQDPDSIKFPDIKIFGPDQFMFPDGTFLDPKDN